MKTIKVDVPVTAKLVVVPEHGEPWDATDEDLERFGFVNRQKTYWRAHEMLGEGLDVEDWDHVPRVVSQLRHLIECAISYDHSPWKNADGEVWPEILDGESEDPRVILREVLMP